MLIIGERINGMFKDVREAMKIRSTDVIKSLANRQISCGASFLDISVGPFSEAPLDDMIWLIDCLAEFKDIGFCIDTPNIDVMRKAVKYCEGRSIIINSTNADEDKIEEFSDLALQYNTDLVALCSSTECGVPQDKESRIEVILWLNQILQEKGLDTSRIFIDPVLLPVANAQNHIKCVLDVMAELSALEEDRPRFIVGLSNISQQIKNKTVVENTFLIAAVTLGLDAAIMNVFNQNLMESLKTFDIIKDETVFCEDYLNA